MERDPSAVGLLQRVGKAGVIFEILIDDFELAFELDGLALPYLRLSCGWAIGVAGLGETGGAGEQHHDGQKE